MSYCPCPCPCKNKSCTNLRRTDVYRLKWRYSSNINCVGKKGVDSVCPCDDDDDDDDLIGNQNGPFSKGEDKKPKSQVDKKCCCVSYSRGFSLGFCYYVTLLLLSSVRGEGSEFSWEGKTKKKSLVTVYVFDSRRNCDERLSVDHHREREAERERESIKETWRDKN